MDWLFLYNNIETKFLKYKEEEKMEELAKKIIQKVRSMYKYDTLLEDIVKTSATVTISERDGELYLSHITFNWYDVLVVSSSGITYTPDMGRTREIISYDGFDELLNM